MRNILLCLSFLLFAACGSDHKNKGREDSNNAPGPGNGQTGNQAGATPITGDPAGLNVQGMSKNLQYVSVNGRVNHSHLLLVLLTDQDTVNFKRATITASGNTVDIKAGPGPFGDAKQYLSGRVTESEIAPMKLDADTKRNLLTIGKNQPFFYIDGFTYNPISNDYSIDFVYEYKGILAKKETKNEGTKK